MNMEYQQKLKTAEEAVGYIQSGDRVFLGCSSSVSYVLTEALWARRGELENVELSTSNLMRPTPICGRDPSPFRLITPFLGPGERAARTNGQAVSFTSVHLSQVDIWCRRTAKPDVCFLEVTPPDEEGYMSYGAGGGCLNTFMLESARLIIAHVNREVPYVTGEACRIHVSEVDVIVEADDPLPQTGEEPVDEVTQRISDHILELVPDGATVQLGIGRLSTAVGYGLQRRNDLGVYSELFNDPLMHLIKNGNVTNTKKGYMDGLSVFSFAVGSREMYRFMDHNPTLYCGTFPFVNDARNIAKNNRMISINSAMAVDLYGQVAADSLGWKQQSGVGGQVDFVKGAQWSDGGKSIIATASSFVKDGVRKSKIMLHFPVGTAVTTARSEVQYVATEYGCVNLKELSMKDRVKAMISLAHPDFRSQLEEDARSHDLL